MPARRIRRIGILLVVTLAAWSAGSSRVVAVDAPYIVRDDAGNWGGAGVGITHQRGPDYQAKKILDLSDVPEAVWQAATEVRLSAFFSVRDYSWHDLPETNGLDETLGIVVGEHVRRVPTGSGVPAYQEGKPSDQSFGWHDFKLPKAWFRRGPNEVIFRMAPPEGKRPDDYLYLGIDNTVPGGRSWVKFGPSADWRQDKLTIPGGPGEYMVRLYVLTGSRAFEATWRPGDEMTEDPAGLIQYAGSHGDDLRVEWDPRRLDRQEPLTLEIETAGDGPLTWSWLDGEGAAVEPVNRAAGPRHEVTLEPPLDFVPAGIRLEKNVPLRKVTLRASESYHPLPARRDMAPHVASPAGRRADRPASCQIGGDRIVLENDNLRCVFRRNDGRLRLQSLVNELAAAEMIRDPAGPAVFLIEVDGKRYAGSRDFVCQGVEPAAEGDGFQATLFSAEIGLEAVLSARVDRRLHLELCVTNRGDRPVDFKVAFPHLSRMAISDEPVQDYYFYPWGGGIISDAPAVLRQGYGDHQAIYQVIDLFGPQRGAGLAVWLADKDGRYKVLALRKHVPGEGEFNGDSPRTPTADEYKWTGSLAAEAGTGVAYEYLRRTRKPGESFSPAPAVLFCHQGDWHAAMAAYADWCHRVWDFRPYPSRLAGVWNMIAAGWGRSPLFRDGKYRTDFIRPRTDCIELMSWWEWSTLGPGGFPLDQLEEKLGAAKAERWKSYILDDPVTGRPVFSNNPGDYDGYNERFGGLPALREAMEQYRKMGAMVTLYTDPFRVDRATKCGGEFGELWGVVKPDGTYRDDYDAWRMCHDTPGYRRWVAYAMKRVLRETGADGIRLDEYGHAGSACFSTRHEHTFAETGCTEWQRGVAEATRLVRRAMDEVNSEAVLTTEHPGYDFLLPYIEGCITYDLTVLATPLRPVECNLQRFYFPECKAYELDHRGADPLHRKRLFNAVGSFGSYYPAAMDTLLRENADAFGSRDCRPLVRTRAEHVYANRFSAPGKTLWTIYNATGHTFVGEVLAVDVGPQQHVVDLLRCREADVRMVDGARAVHLFLERGDVACLALLPGRISVARGDDVLDVTADGAAAGSTVGLCDAAGQPIVTAPVRDGSARFAPSKLPKGSPAPACVKLYEGGLLVDLVGVAR